MAKIPLVEEKLAQRHLLSMFQNCSQHQPRLVSCKVQEVLQSMPQRLHTVLCVQGLRAQHSHVARHFEHTLHAKNSCVNALGRCSSQQVLFGASCASRRRTEPRLGCLLHRRRLACGSDGGSSSVDASRSLKLCRWQPWMLWYDMQAKAELRGGSGTFDPSNQNKNGLRSTQAIPDRPMESNTKARTSNHTRDKKEDGRGSK